MRYFEILCEAGESRPGGDLWRMLFPLIMLGAIFYFFLLRPKHREQKQRQQMLGKIKKHDKVMTIGGIIGTVMEAREDEVILKVDESTNTRMKFGRSAIQRVLTKTDTEKSEK